MEIDDDNKINIPFVFEICDRMSHGALQRVMRQAQLARPVTLMVLGGTVVSIILVLYY